MTALADTTQLKAVMGRDLTGGDVERAKVLLDQASAKVHAYTGLAFTQATTTIRVKVRNGKARLPQWPVTAVTAVTDMDGNTVSFEWWSGQTVDCNPTLLNEFEINLRRISPKWVDVTYTHGWAEVPDDVVGVVCDMAAAALDNPPEAGSLTGETVGPFSQQHGSIYAGVLMTQAMRDTLAHYLTGVGTAPIS